MRVISLIDGLNLYHAILRLKRPELRWVNLRELSEVFVKKRSEHLSEVYYFFSIASHIEDSVSNHKAHVEALRIKDVKTVFGHFKKKHRGKCSNCNQDLVSHEEKQSDVNLALFLLDNAYRNTFDRALIISNDSDLVPAIKMVRERFPEKRITTVAPPNCFHSNELIQASSDKTKVRVEHLERSLLPAVVFDPRQMETVFRPHEYATFEKATSKTKQKLVMAK